MALRPVLTVLEVLVSGWVQIEVARVVASGE